MSIALGGLACAADLENPGAESDAVSVWPDKQLSIDEDGNIDPKLDFVHDGQTAVWTFANPSPANAIVRQTWDGTAYVAAPYDPNYVNELMTPLPKGMSGVFVISETGGGFVERDAPCDAPSVQKATRMVGMTQFYLCTTAPSDPATYQRTMDSTLENPAITGVFIRLKWSDLQTGPNTFDDTILLREVDRAVAAGKLYSIGIKSGAENGATPTWLFDPTGGGLTPVELDWSEGGASCNATTHSYGNPTDPLYGEHYRNMLTHVASVLKEDSARWRSLAYVKISGANVRSAENKLPSGCAAGCICNNEVWANAGYTPNALYGFFQEQMAHIAEEFPGKSMSYSLIQAGFPRVNNEGCYLDETDTKICPPSINTSMVGPFAQTAAIINHARTEYGDDVAIAHLGLGQTPDFSDPLRYQAGTGCPLPLDPSGGLAHGPNGVGSGCPNKWASDVGNVGGLTHYQTNNASGVATMAELDSTLHNMWSNSNSAMLEIYEARAWEANDSVLDPTQPLAEQRKLSDWNTLLHERRRDDFPDLGDPAPTSISFTFTRSIDPYETFYYFVPKSGPRENSSPSPLLGYLNLLY